jgi:TetR/AcrR family transcriptional regulator
MSTKDLNTEEQILEASKKVFIRKGFDGARMQEIADEAGINKSLLHYYYRSKDKLFEGVFKEAFRKFIPAVGNIFNTEGDLFEKIKKIIDVYIDMLIVNPYIPIFILNEINRNPEKILQMIKLSGVKPENFVMLIHEAVKKKKIKPISPEQLIVNMLSLCIFPFAGRPIIQGMIFNNNKKAYDKFLMERKKEITKFIFSAIKK